MTGLPDFWTSGLLPLPSAFRTSGLPDFWTSFFAFGLPAFWPSGLLDFRTSSFAFGLPPSAFFPPIFHPLFNAINELLTTYKSAHVLRATAISVHFFFHLKFIKP